MRRISWLNPRGKAIALKAQPWLWLACIVMFFVAAWSAQAQVDIFMSVGGQPQNIGVNPQTSPTLKGDSKDSQYPQWIQLFSAQMGVGRGVTLNSGTVSTSNPSFSEVTITKLTDSTTPSLYTLCSGGTATVTQPIDYVTIDFRKTGTTQVFYRLQLQKVYISGISSSSGGDVPSESVSLFFSRVSWSYVPYDTSGKVGQTVTKGWDVIKNAAF